MDESNRDHNELPGEKFGYLRDQFRPKREEGGDLLKESGLDPKSTEFKRGRYKVGRRLLEKQIESERDGLTQILNLKGFNRRLQEEIARKKRLGEAMGDLMMVSLDANNLKLINDTQGHLKGDKYLKNIADVLREASRITDVVARSGGDEFIVVLCGTDVSGVRAWWERANKTFALKKISISAGFCKLDLNDIEKSKKLSDQLMYKSKDLCKQDGINRLLEPSTI